MRRIKTYDSFNEGLVDWLKGRSAKTPAPKQTPFTFRGYDDFLEKLKAIDPTNPATIMSVSRAVATTDRSMYPGEQQDLYLSLLVAKVVTEGTAESCGALMAELSRYPWDKSTWRNPRSGAVELLWWAMPSGDMFLDGPKESDTLDIYAARLAMCMCFSGEMTRRTYRNLSSKNITLTLPFIIKYAVKKSIRLGKPGFDGLVSFVRSPHYTGLSKQQHKADLLRVLMYGMFCGLDPHPGLMKDLGNAKLSEQTGEAFGDPAELFEILKRFMATHGTPTLIMSVIKRVFPKEYEAEFGKDDMAADMGDLGF